VKRLLEFIHVFRSSEIAGSDPRLSPVGAPAARLAERLGFEFMQVKICPVALFSGRIVDQHTVDRSARKFAAVVPHFVAIVARDHEEARRHPLVATPRPELLLNLSRRVSGRAMAQQAAMAQKDFAPNIPYKYPDAVVMMAEAMPSAPVP